jgi:hypothetical protein
MEAFLAEPSAKNLSARAMKFGASREIDIRNWRNLVSSPYKPLRWMQELARRPVVAWTR